MKIEKTAGKTRIKISKSEWNEIGRKHGWTKTAGIIDTVKRETIKVDNINDDEAPQFINATIVYAENNNDLPLTDEQLETLQGENPGLAGQIIIEQQLWVKVDEDAGKDAEDIGEI